MWVLWFVIICRCIVHRKYQNTKSKMNVARGTAEDYQSNYLAFMGWCLMLSAFCLYKFWGFCLHILLLYYLAQRNELYIFCYSKSEFGLDIKKLVYEKSRCCVATYCRIVCFAPPLLLFCMTSFILWPDYFINWV